MHRPSAAPVLAALLGVAVGAACGPVSPRPAQPPATLSAPAAELAGQGEQVYAQQCAACHGSTGQGGAGPPVGGTSAALTKFRTAAGLYGSVQRAMPQGRPGSLTPDEYFQVLSYLLVENRYVAQDAMLPYAQLGTIELR